MYRIMKRNNSWEDPTLNELTSLKKDRHVEQGYLQPSPVRRGKFNQMTLLVSWKHRQSGGNFPSLPKSTIPPEVLKIPQLVEHSLQAWGWFQPAPSQRGELYGCHNPTMFQRGARPLQSCACRFSVPTATLLLRQSWPLIFSRGCTLPTYQAYVWNRATREREEGTAPLPTCQYGTLILFSYQAWSLELVLLLFFIFERKVKYSYLLSIQHNLACSNFREITSLSSMALYSLRFLMEFSKEHLPLYLTGICLCTMVESSHRN